MNTGQELIYDLLFEHLDRLQKELNPCKRRVEDGELRCAGVSRNYSCCTTCKHLSSHGCTIRVLTCKMWLCREAFELMPVCDRQAWLVETRKVAEAMREAGIKIHWRDREQAIPDALYISDVPEWFLDKISLYKIKDGSIVSL